MEGIRFYIVDVRAVYLAIYEPFFFARQNNLIIYLDISICSAIINI